MADSPDSQPGAAEGTSDCTGGTSHQAQSDEKVDPVTPAGYRGAGVPHKKKRDRKPSHKPKTGPECAEA
jgi:hypothetical protein